MGLYSITPADQLVWIRLERGLKEEDKSGLSKMRAMIVETVPAYDTVTISYHRRQVTPPYALPQENLEFQDPVTLEHLVVLLRMMDETASGYNLLNVGDMARDRGGLSC